jgi:hypothetical protein
MRRPRPGAVFVAPCGVANVFCARIFYSFFEGPSFHTASVEPGHWLSAGEPTFERVADAGRCVLGDEALCRGQPSPGRTFAGGVPTRR